VAADRRATVSNRLKRMEIEIKSISKDMSNKVDSRDGSVSLKSIPSGSSLYVLKNKSLLQREGCVSDKLGTVKKSPSMVSTLFQKCDGPDSFTTAKGEAIGYHPKVSTLMRRGGS